MAIDIGDIPTGTPPTAGEKLQIRSAIGVGTTDAPTFAGVTSTEVLTIPVGSKTSTSLRFGTQGATTGLYSSNAGTNPGIALAIGGTVYIATWDSNRGMTLHAEWPLSWGSTGADSTPDLFIQRDAAGILAQRNGSLPQAFRVANQVGALPLTDYDRAVFDFKTTLNTLRIGTENSGTTGYTTARPIDFVTGGVVRMSVGTTGLVGIGTATPASGLHISGALGTNVTTYDSDAALKLTNTTGNSSWLLTSGVIGVINGSFSIRQDSTSQPALVISGIGNNVGIGINTPVAKTDIADTWNAPALAVTAASGTGSTATLTFATQSTAIPVGSTIVVAGVTPAGYNGTFVVTGSTTATVLYANATTGAGTGGTIERVFTSVKLNVTDTASNAASKLMDLRLGNVSKFSVDKNGTNLSDGWYFITNSSYLRVQTTGGQGYLQISPGTTILNTRSLAFSDATIVNPAANILELRNLSAAQTLRIYNTYTSASIYERAVMDWNGPTPGNLQIGTEFLGSGSGMAARPIDFVTGGMVRMSINTSGHTVISVGRRLYLDSTGTGAYFIASGDNMEYSGAGAWNRLNIGGSTAAFPAIKRNGTGIDIRLADDSSYASLGAQDFTGYNGGIAKLYLGGAGVVQTVSTGWFGIASSATNVFAGDTFMSRSAPGVWQMGTSSTNATADLRLRSVIQQPPATITPANNGDLVVEATSNTLLTFKYKGLDGTVRSGTMAVA